MAVNAMVRDFNAYKLALRLKRTHLLLVEGEDDWAIMRSLLDALHAAGKLPHHVGIDAAQNIKSPDNRKLGNREMIEELCTSLMGTRGESYIAGFIDREYRYFVIDGAIDDELKRHYLDGRIVWSRGHSIENYFLDYSLFAELLGYYSRARARPQALAMLQPLFPAVLRSACALALAAKDHDKLDAVRATIRWQELRLEPSVALDKDAWIQLLAEKHPKLDGEALYGGYEAKVNMLSQCDEETIRWLCDGHLAVSIALASYQRAVYEISGEHSAADNALAIKRKDFVPCGAREWSRRACEGQVCWPADLTTLLTA